MIEPKKNIRQLLRTPPTFGDRIGKVIRLDRNERTVPFPERHLKRIWRNITPEDVVAYPELEPFYKKLSGWLGVARDEVLLFNGSDTGIRAVYEVYVEEGDEVLMFPPTYGMYLVYCRMFGGVVKEIFYNEDFTLPVEQILNAINHKTKLITVANPNHTGTTLEKSDLIRILKAAKDKDAIVLVDEAYYHFCDETMVSYI